MKHVKCSDVTGLACAFVAHGETKGGVTREIMDHGMEAHKDTMEKMSKKDEKMMAEKMHTALHAH